MGDVIHNLPLVDDIRRAYPQAIIDWVVEENYADLVRLHPGVHQVIPIGLRRWRRTLWLPSTWADMRAFWRRLRAKPYDVVIDTQSLLKSAVVSWCAHGQRVGYTRTSCREPVAACFYQRRLDYPPVKAVHAVQRYRDLAAWALGYALPPDAVPSYGLAARFAEASPLGHTPTWHPAASRYAVLLHATARPSKLWPEPRWRALVQALTAHGIQPVLAWGNPTERERALRLIGDEAKPGTGLTTAVSAVIAPRVFNLLEWAHILARASVVVGLDTGLTYLAAAVGTPVVALYVDTAPEQAGVCTKTPHRNLGGIGQLPEASLVVTTALSLAESNLAQHLTKHLAQHLTQQPAS